MTVHPCLGALCGGVLIGLAAVLLMAALGRIAGISGIAGYCPGPALASLGAGMPALLLLVACMVAGWWLAARLLPPAGGD